MHARMRPADNPFSARRIDAIPYRMPEEAWAQLCARLEALRFCGAITGPHGAGKTTLLERIAAHLRSRGLAVAHGFLNSDNRRGALSQVRNQLLACGPDTIFLLDGAEQLGPLSWRYVKWRTRKFRGFIVTCHAPGRLPEVYRCETSAPLLDALLKELAPECDASVRNLAHQTLLRRKGNLREVFFELYDYHAAR